MGSAESVNMRDERRDTLAAFISRERGLVAMAAMAVVGIAIAAYLTTVHYAKIPLACTTGGVVNCSAVTSSRFSVVPGTQLPITIPGMLWFIASGALAVVALVAARRGQPEPPRLRAIHALLGAAGLLFVLYLIYAEIVQLHRICEWCTVIHILTLATFLIALTRWQRADDDQLSVSAPATRAQLAATSSGASASRATSTTRRVAAGSQRPPQRARRSSTAAKARSGRR